MKKLVIIGTGPQHLHLLLALSQQALEGVQVTLVAPSLRQLYGPMLAGFVAGQLSEEACLIDLEAVIKNTGIRYLPLSVTALDASAQTLTLSNGKPLAFDWLTVNLGDVADRAQLELQLPGVREHGLFLQPSDAFSKFWPSVLTLAKSRTLRFAVLGSSLQSVEVALAVRHHLPSASVTLVLPSTVLAQLGSAAFQARLVLALKQARITVLDDQAVSFSAGQVMLGCGAALVCDVPIVALGASAPGWLAGNDLALDAQGFIATDVQQRSSSHPGVFCADQASASGPQTVWRRRGAQVATDSALSQALFATLKGLPAPAPVTPKKSLTFTATSGRVALASGGRYAVQGRLVWRLKNWLDRAAVQRLRRP